MTQEIAIIIGTRAELIKTFPIMLELKKINRDYFFIHTGQHSLGDLCKIFEVKTPDIILSSEPNKSSKFNTKESKAIIWAIKIIFKIRKELRKLKEIKYVIFHGDTLSTCVSSIGSSRLLNPFKKYKNVHLEGGLRSASMKSPFPEEIIRRIVTYFSDILFIPSEEARLNVENKDHYYVIGNTILDSVHHALKIGETKNLKPLDEKFALDTTEMQAEDWILTFGLNIIEPVAVIIERTLSKLKGKKYDINDIISSINQDKETTQEIRNAAAGLFEAAQTWGVFAGKYDNPTQTKDLVTAGSTTVLDLSIYNAVGAFNVRALVISLISRKIFNQRMTARKKEEVEAVAKGLEFSEITKRKEDPLVWIFIDEAHEFLPLNNKTIATDALVQLLREGRQPGISLVLATQQPGMINRDVMTQSDIVIAHRVTSQPDVESLNYIMQSYLLASIKKYIDELPDLKGSAILLDDNSERIYPMRVRPRFTWHGGEAPTAVKIRKKI